MLPALMDRENGEVVFGPEAIVFTIIERIAKKPELMGKTPEDRVRHWEIRALYIDMVMELHKTVLLGGKTSECREAAIKTIKDLITHRVKKLESILGDKRKTILTTSTYSLSDLLIVDITLFAEKAVPGFLPNICPLVK